MTYMRTLRFAGAFALNLAIAVIGTAVIESDFWRLLRFRDPSVLILKEWFFSIVIAALFGFLMYWKRPSETSKWIWILPTLWFGFGAIVVGGQRQSIFSPGTGAWANLSRESCKLDASSCRAFFAFTVPLIRAVAYSVAALIASRFLRPQASPHELNIKPPSTDESIPTR
jgi:hypothetical protein